LDFATVGLAFIAIIFAVISFVKREEKRAYIAGALLGIGAITFNFLTNRSWGYYFRYSSSDFGDIAPFFYGPNLALKNSTEGPTQE